MATKKHVIIKVAISSWCHLITLGASTHSQTAVNGSKWKWIARIETISVRLHFAFAPCLHCTASSKDWTKKYVKLAEGESCCMYLCMQCALNNAAWFYHQSLVSEQSFFFRSPTTLSRLLLLHARRTAFAIYSNLYAQENLITRINFMFLFSLARARVY